MAEVKWTPQAASDLEAIAEFIALDSVAYARKFAATIFESTDQLKSFPKSGRVVPEYNQDPIRELLKGNYRVIYRVTGEFVEILAVHHGARKLGQLESNGSASPSN